MTRTLVASLLLALAACTVTTPSVDDVPLTICEADSRDARCVSVPERVIGAGPSFASLGAVASLHNGFIDDSTLVVAAATGVDALGHPLGAIVAVDLHTRARTVAVGSYQDPARGVVDGTSSHQPSIRLAPLADVQPTHDPSQWFAVGDDGLLAIARSGDVHPLLPRTATPSCDGVDVTVTVSFATLAVDTRDDTVFLVADDTRVLAFDPTTHRCRIVSDNVHTAGPPALTVHALRFAHEALYALDDLSLFRIDLATGERIRVTSASGYGRVGAGSTLLGNAHVDPSADDGIWTAGNGGLFVSVDPESGDRTRFEPSFGPTLSFDIGGVWRLPGTPVLVATAGPGVVVANVYTGSVNWLSR